MNQYKITIERRRSAMSVGVITAERKSAALTKMSMRMIDDDVEKITIKQISEFEAVMTRKWIS